MGASDGEREVSMGRQDPVVVTPEEMLEEFKRIKRSNRGDPEKAHIEMDELMVAALHDLGYDKAMAFYEKQTRWYA